MILDNLPNHESLRNKYNYLSLLLIVLNYD